MNYAILITLKREGNHGGRVLRSGERCEYMSRREFINLLTDSLAGRVPSRLISEKADYYRQYITDRAREIGQSEEEIIEELGPPELIAHTIIDVYEAEYGVYEGGAADAVYEDVGNRAEAEEDDTGRRRFFSLNLGGNGCFLISFLVVVLFLAIGIWMVKFIAAYPLLVIIVVLMVYLWTHSNRRN